LPINSITSFAIFMDSLHPYQISKLREGIRSAYSRI
jgi:hypothetical protein